MQGSSVTELAPRFYEQVLLSVLKGALYKEGKEGKEGVGAFESDSPKRALCEILLGIDYKDLEHSTEALTRFFALDALMTQTGRFTRLDAVDQPDQIRLEYPWGDSKLHLTFSHTHTASQGSELTKEQLVNNSTLASRDDLYGYAQRLNKPKVAAYIEQVQSEENKKISLSLNMPLNDTLNDTMATLSLSEVKQEAAGAKEEGVAVEVCEHVFERWEKGASSLRKYMTDATGTINPCRSIAFTSLDTSIEDASSVLINYMGNPLQLNAENIVEAHSDESLSGGATLFIESRSLGRPAIIKGDFTLNKSEGLQLNSDQALFESGGAQYEGPVKFIKNSQGKIVDVVA